MKKLALYFAYALMASSTALFVGCDLDSITGSSSSGGSSFTYEETRYVQSKSQPTAQQSSEGVRSVVRCGDLTVLIMEYTSIQRARGSCSGLDNAGDVEIDDLIVVYFADDQIDWATGEVKPGRIEAYARECVPVLKPQDECEPCGE